MLFLCASLLGATVLGVVAQGGGTGREQLTSSPCSVDPPSTIQLSTLDSVLQELQLGGGDQSFLLQPGEHCVRDFSLVRDVAGLSFIGQDSVRVNCLPGRGLAFYNVTSLSFINIAIDGCGMGPYQVNMFLSMVRSSIEFFFNITETPDQYVAMAVGNCNNFLMEDSSVVGTSGLGFLGINLIGQSRLSNVTFAQNVPDGCFHANGYNLSYEKIGGGALFAYHDYKDYDNYNDLDMASLDISNCHFIENSYCGYGTFYLSFYRFEESNNRETNVVIGGGGGLSLQLTQLQYGVNVTVNNSNFRNNTALYGGGAHVAIFTGVFNSLVIFNGCHFVSNGVDESVATDLTSYPIVGSAILVIKDLVQPDFRIGSISRDAIPTNVQVVDSEFVNNTAFTGIMGVFSLYNLVVPEHSRTEIELVRCLFQSNQAVYGPAMFAVEQKATALQLGVGLTLRDVQIENNKLLFTHRVQSPSDTSGVIHLVQLNMTLTGTSSLKHSIGSAIKAESSTIHLQDNVTFYNNSAAYGGGIHLEGSSIIVVANNATVSLYNNTGAVAGGAIYVRFTTTSTPFIYQDCFLYFDVTLDCTYFGSCGDVTTYGVNIIFEGNQAYLGNMIYGSTLETCPWSTTFRNMYAPGTEFTETHLFEILYMYDRLNFTSPFKFDRAPDDVMAVSTPIINLSATDPSTSESEEPKLITELFMAPGIKRDIELSAFDAFGRLVPSVVTSRASTANAISVLGSNYTFLNYNSTGSTTLMVTAGDSKPGSTVAVSLFTVDNFAQFGITINFTDCPNGFYFNETFDNCTCNEYLSNYFVSCTDDGRLLVPINAWVGIDENDLYHVLCSFDYCRPLVAVVSTEQESYFEQCNVGYNRTGIGCGSCATNFSSTLGSNRCRECTNSSLWLLLIFAAYGILLMLTLLLLRISISGGFLNGILFFSNIASLYAPYYAPNSSFLLFSWLSLKIGFETCFYNGMKPLHVAVLNCIFPLYLYLLLLVIVLLARWSSRFSHWLARSCSNPIQLFATILVMTYSSLLESCIQALSFTIVTEFGGNNISDTHVRWRHDPNQEYFHGVHGALATFSVVLVLFFLIPAPILWMFPAKILSIKILRKYKPVYDAVWAPLKPRYRFWVSLRLLFRVVPLILVSFLPSPLSLIQLGFFLLVISFIHGMVQPFEGTAQNVFDGFLQLLLTLMTFVSVVFALHLEQTGVSQDVDTVELTNSDLQKLEQTQRSAILTLLSIAYISCIVIFIWHVMHHFTKLRTWVVRAWNTVACKRFHVKVPRQTSIKNSISSSTAVIQAEDTSSNYGSTDAETPTRDSKSNKEVATFSELREPLLDDSIGLADLHTLVN